MGKGKKMHFFCIFFQKNLVISKKSSTFAPAFEIEGARAEKNGLLNRFRERRHLV